MPRKKTTQKATGTSSKKSTTKSAAKTPKTQAAPAVKVSAKTPAKPKAAAQTATRAAPKAKAKTTAKAGSSKSTAKTVICRAPSQEAISLRAYEIWLRKGKPWGQDESNWLEAEAELTAKA